MVDQNGISTIYRAGSPFRNVVVTSVGASTSEVFDTKANNSFSCSNSTPDGRTPQVGDRWICSNALGVWAFYTMLRSASTDQVVSSQEEFQRLTAKLEGFRWLPNDAPSRIPEYPAGAFIGERRIFEQVPTADWVKLDGSLIQIYRYRQLYKIYGLLYGGNGITTFGVPLAPPVSTMIPTYGGGTVASTPASWYVRAA